MEAPFLDLRQREMQTASWLALYVLDNLALMLNLQTVTPGLYRRYFTVHLGLLQNYKCLSEEICCWVLSGRGCMHVLPETKGKGKALWCMSPTCFGSQFDTDSLERSSRPKQNKSRACLTQSDKNQIQQEPGLTEGADSWYFWNKPWLHCSWN